MARPRKNNADYFSHDNSMRNHRKIKALRNTFGIEGYGIFNMFLETQTESDNFKIRLATEIDWELIAADFGVETSKLKEVIEYCIKIDLIKTDKTYYYSDNLIERLKPLTEKREQFREKYVSEAETPVSDAETPISEAETPVSDAEMPHSKVNKSKVNISKDIVPLKNKKYFLNQRRAELGREPVEYKQTHKQKLSVKRMRCLDYFHAEGIKQGFDYLEEEDDQANRKFIGLARSFEKRYPNNWKEVIDWWFGGDNAWCDYHPSNFFSIGNYMKFDNKHNQSKVIDL